MKLTEKTIEALFMTHMKEDTLACGIAFARAVEDALRHPVPVGYQYRHCDEVSCMQGWSYWKPVERRFPMDCIHRRAEEIQQYIDNGYKYELRALYVEPGKEVE